MKFENVIIFGDSLTDIGNMWDSNLSAFRRVGAFLLNDTGRFSDFRNWTDYMFKEVSGEFLIDSKQRRTTRAKSKPYRTFSDNCLVDLGQPFGHLRYANYAVGGACGFTPYSNVDWLALTTFNDEISSFKKDYDQIKAQIDQNENFLFIIWFGANDLYTAGRPAIEMEQVAEHITGTCRQKILDILGQERADYARFVYINLGLPLSATFYVNLNARVDLNGLTATGSLSDASFKVRKIINNLTSGALLFNKELKERCKSNPPDLYVDMADIINPDTIRNNLSDRLKVREGSQPKGTQNTYKLFTPESYRERFFPQLHPPLHPEPSQQPCQYPYMTENLPAHSPPLEYMTLEDDKHPTDHVYGLMWTVIKIMLKQKKWTFGMLDHQGQNPKTRNISAVHNLEEYVKDLMKRREHIPS